MEESQEGLQVQHLRRFLAERNHAMLLAAFESAATFRDDYIQALGGEGLCLLLKSNVKSCRRNAKRYAALLLNRTIVAPPDAILKLAALLQSEALASLATYEQDKRERYSSKETGRYTSETPPQAVLQVRRVVQIVQMFLGDGQFSNSARICRSIFHSQQERTFLRALTLRFPGLLALPNYPLDQIVALDRMGEFNTRVLRYGRNCRLDAVLIIPDEGDPVAVFELDSPFHDRPDRALRDDMKNNLIAATGLPFFRLRAESPDSMTIDDWYALLSDQVLPHIDLGKRIRFRQAMYRLIPC